mgnify:CR=1 FL=1
MEETMTREQAWALLQKYNQEPFHLEHGLTLEGVMGWYAGNWVMVRMQHSGSWQDCCMILI